MVQFSDTAQEFTPSENMRGGLLMALAMAGFGINDIIVKYLASSMELGQTIFIRGIFATAFIWILAKATGKLRPLKTVLQPAMFVRAMGEVLATLTFLIALFNMPIANTTAILQALPLVVTLGAAIFFREKIGWRRIGAIGVGFVGVLIIIRPGMEGFTIYSIAVLGTVFFAAIRDLSTRFIAKDIPSLLIALFTSVLVTIMGAVLSINEDWSSFDPMALGWLMLAAGFLIVGYSCIASSMRTGEVSVIVPFRYTILLYATLAGIFVFDEIPDAMTIVGSMIIVGTGIFTIYRERVRSRSQQTSVEEE